MTGLCGTVFTDENAPNTLRPIPQKPREDSAPVPVRNLPKVRTPPPPLEPFWTVGSSNLRATLVPIRSLSEQDARGFH